MTIGKLGQPTSLDYDAERIKAVDERLGNRLPAVAPPKEAVVREVKTEAPQSVVAGAGRIFITDRGNRQIPGQVRKPAGFGKLKTVAARSHEPPEKRVDAMRSCKAAVIHAGAESVHDENGREASLINENALLELCAATVFAGAISSRLPGTGQIAGRSAGCARVPIQWRGIGWNIHHDADKGFR